MRVVIGLFVWLIGPRWCVIIFVISKSMFSYVWIINCETHLNYFKKFDTSVTDFVPFCGKMHCHGSHKSGLKVWPCYIQFCVIAVHIIMGVYCNSHTLIFINALPNIWHMQFVHEYWENRKIMSFIIFPHAKWTLSIWTINLSCAIIHRYLF